jgi:hypothetical protein
MIMPRFYFHLSNSQECFRDNMGRDLPDLAAAHARAQRLARRMMLFSNLTSYEPDWRRWTIAVTDDRKGPILTVLFACVGDGRINSRLPRLFSPRFDTGPNDCGATLITYP